MLENLNKNVSLIVAVVLLLGVAVLHLVYWLKYMRGCRRVGSLNLLLNGIVISLEVGNLVIMGTLNKDIDISIQQYFCLLCYLTVVLLTIELVSAFKESAFLKDSSWKSFVIMTACSKRMEAKFKAENPDLEYKPMTCPTELPTDFVDVVKNAVSITASGVDGVTMSDFGSSKNMITLDSLRPDEVLLSRDAWNAKWGKQDFEKMCKRNAICLDN